MKGLNAFRKFNWDGFSKDKTFTVKGVGNWTDFETKAVLGTKIDVVITKDNTKYETKNGEQISNLYAELSFKVNKDMKNSITIGSNVVPVNPIVVVYGQYNEKLSIKCEDIQTLKIS